LFEYYSVLCTSCTVHPSTRPSCQGSIKGVVRLARKIATLRHSLKKKSRRPFQRMYCGATRKRQRRFEKDGCNGQVYVWSGMSSTPSRCRCTDRPSRETTTTASLLIYGHICLYFCDGACYYCCLVSWLCLLYVRNLVHGGVTCLVVRTSPPGSTGLVVVDLLLLLLLLQDIPEEQRIARRRTPSPAFFGSYI